MREKKHSGISPNTGFWLILTNTSKPCLNFQDKSCVMKILTWWVFLYNADSLWWGARLSLKDTAGFYQVISLEVWPWMDTRCPTSHSLIWTEEKICWKKNMGNDKGSSIKQKLHVKIKEDKRFILYFLSARNVQPLPRIQHAGSCSRRQML